MSDMDELVDEVLSEGLDDWLMLVSIVQAAQARRPGDQAAARALAVELIKELLQSGWMVAGELGEPNFVPWELSPSEAAQRIVDDLEDVKWDVVHNVVAWFCNTEKGDKRAQALS